MIVIDHISKQYGQQVAVDDLSFSVKPGVVTGFLGPNGAGKSTTMRMIIGLDRPDSGQITIDGRHYAEHRARCMWSAHCSTPRRSTRPGRPATTCSRSAPPPASPRAGSTKCWTSSG